MYVPHEFVIELDLSFCLIGINGYNCFYVIMQLENQKSMSLVDWAIFLNIYRKPHSALIVLCLNQALVDFTYLRNIFG